MKKSLKPLFFALLVAIALLPVFYGIHLSNASNHKKLVDSCVKGNKEKTLANAESLSKKAASERFLIEYPMDECDKNIVYYKDYGQLSEIEKSIRFSNDGSQWLENYSLVAGFIMLFGCIPLAWYFLLARIAEIAKAIRGEK